MKQEYKGNFMFLGKIMVLAYILTAFALLLLAFLLYKLRFSSGVIGAAIIGIYVFVTVISGFVTGKRMQKKKYLWGLLAGALYFVILAVASSLYGTEGIGASFLTTALLCMGGGMLGYEVTSYLLAQLIHSAEEAREIREGGTYK